METSKKVAPKAKATTKGVKNNNIKNAKAESAQVIKILSALYGINDVRIEVAQKIQVGKKINNRIAGQDPAPGNRKQLVVTAKVDGKKVEKTFNEGQVVAF